jgi:hypothetical protein
LLIEAASNSVSAVTGGSKLAHPVGHGRGEGVVVVVIDQARQPYPLDRIEPLAAVRHVSPGYA